MVVDVDSSAEVPACLPFGRAREFISPSRLQDLKLPGVFMDGSVASAEPMHDVGDDLDAGCR